MRVHVQSECLLCIDVCARGPMIHGGQLVTCTWRGFREVSSGGMVRRRCGLGTCAVNGQIRKIRKRRTRTKTRSRVVRENMYMNIIRT